MMARRVMTSSFSSSRRVKRTVKHQLATPNQDLETVTIVEKARRNREVDTTSTGVWPLSVQKKILTMMTSNLIKRHLDMNPRVMAKSTVDLFVSGMKMSWMPRLSPISPTPSLVRVKRFLVRNLLKTTSLTTIGSYEEAWSDCHL
jgi:hypothetical protein